MKRLLVLSLWLLLATGVFAQTTRTIGSGSPEGVVTAGPGSVYQRTDCTGSNCLYLKTGTGNTGWTAVDPTAGGSITALTGDVTATGPGSAAATIANGAVTNAKLANSSLSIAGTSTSLGGSISLDMITGLGSTGLVKRTGANALGIAISGTDYAPATSGSAILYGNGSGGFSSVTVGSGLNFSGGTLSATGGGSQTPWTGAIDANGFNLRVTDGTGIQSNETGNPNLLLFSSAASAVNSITITNAGTGAPPTISATGSDTDIGLYLKVKNGDSDTTSGQIYGDPMVRYDYPTYSFYHPSNLFRAYGMGLNAGGGALSITGPSVVSIQAGDGVPGVVALQGLSVLGFSERNSTGIDCPQCQVVGIKKGSRHSIAVVGSDYPADGDFPNGATLNFPASTPSQITSNQNDFNPATFSYNQHWSSDASRNVTGLVTSSTQDSVTVTQVDGQIHRIWNVGSNAIVLKNQDPASSAANRFLSSTGGDITLAANECAEVQYHGGSVNRWRLTPCASAGGGGTVTTVSVASANGFAGSVANATTTPAITLSTTITGLLKGNGTAISAATSGTDYAPATSGSAILYGNGSGGFSSVTVGSGLSFSGGTLSASGGGGGATPALDNLASVAINAALNTGAGVTFAAASTPPAATTGSSQAGIPLTLTASAAVASTDTNSAAAGGPVTITGGAAARRTSGNADGGPINLTPGAGIGTGKTGAVVVTTGNLAFGGTASTNVAFVPNGTGGAFRRADDSNLSGIIYGGSFAAGAAGSTKIMIDAGNVAPALFISSDSKVYFSGNTNASASLNTAVQRSGADGIIEVNNGTAIGTTAGNARDFKSRVSYLVETGTDPSAAQLTVAGSNAKDTLGVYMKNDKLVFAYNNAGTVTYITIPLDGSTTTFTHSTTAP
jgi:hypothetical protein